MRVRLLSVLLASAVFNLGCVIVVSEKGINKIESTAGNAGEFAGLYENKATYHTIGWYGLYATSNLASVLSLSPSGKEPPEAILLEFGESGNLKATACGGFMLGPREIELDVSAEIEKGKVSLLLGRERGVGGGDSPVFGYMSLERRLFLGSSGELVATESGHAAGFVTIVPYVGVTNARSEFKKLVDPPAGLQCEP